MGNLSGWINFGEWTRRERGITVGKIGEWHMQQSDGRCGKELLYLLGRWWQRRNQLLYG